MKRKGTLDDSIAEGSFLGRNAEASLKHHKAGRRLTVHWSFLGRNAEASLKLQGASNDGVTIVVSSAEMPRPH